jgi:peptidoglycan/LPS O-acetylase OafA/YrhL
VIVLVPPQIHVQRLQAGTAGTYWETLRDFLHVRVTGNFPIPVDGQGTSPFEPAHLWFLAYLLAFTVALLPVLWPLRRDAGRGAALARRLGGRGGLVAAMVAVAVIEGLHAAEDAGGWSRWVYPLFIVFGFLLAADEDAARVLVAVRRRLGAAAVVALAALAASGAALHDRLGDALMTGHTADAVLWRVGQGVTGCLLVGAVVGALLARARPAQRRTPGPVLSWARTMALPVYLVHQTVGVACAYVVLRSGAHVGIAVVAIVVTTTALSVLIAEALRRTPLRAAFGLVHANAKVAGAAVHRGGSDLVASPSG